MGDTPKGKCKCPTHENLFIKLATMGKKYEGSFLDEIFCNTSNNSVCWLNICNAFCYARKFAPMLELAAITNNRQWGNVYVKKQDKTVSIKMNFI